MKVFGGSVDKIIEQARDTKVGVIIYDSNYSRNKTYNI